MMNENFGLTRRIWFFDTFSLAIICIIVIHLIVRPVFWVLAIHAHAQTLTLAHWVMTAMLNANAVKDTMVKHAQTLVSYPPHCIHLISCHFQF